MKVNHTWRRADSKFSNRLVKDLISAPLLFPLSSSATAYVLFWYKSCTMDTHFSIQCFSSAIVVSSFTVSLRAPGPNLIKFCKPSHCFVKKKLSNENHSKHTPQLQNIPILRVVGKHRGKHGRFRHVNRWIDLWGQLQGLKLYPPQPRSIFLDDIRGQVNFLRMPPGHFCHLKNELNSHIQKSVHNITNRVFKVECKIKFLLKNIFLPFIPLVERL